MGTYADSLLTQGEVVIRRERQHWLSLFLETRLSILRLAHRPGAAVHRVQEQRRRSATA